MLSQLGFGVGLVLVAPLDDMVEAKRLVVALLATLCLSLLGVSLAPELLSLGVASALVGACATAVQIIVPVAAATAPDGRRAHFVSIVFTGTLVGILSARIVSGALSEWLSWRILFGFSPSDRRDDVRCRVRRASQTVRSPPQFLLRLSLRPLGNTSDFRR